MAEIGVRLLPLELLEERKLSTHKEVPKRLRNGLPDLGSVLIRLRLHLYENNLPRMLLQDWAIPKPHTIVAGQNGNQPVRLDDPKTVVSAVSVAMTRMKNAMNLDLYRRACRELRETVTQRSVLMALWTYSSMLGRPWHLPVCFVLGVFVFLWQVSQVSAADRRSRPPGFFEEDEEKLSLHERNKERIRKLVDMEIKLVRFARSLTVWASRLEKLRCICSLRDPYISLVCGGLAFALALALGTFLCFLSFVPYGLGPYFVLWMAGMVALLPDPQQETLRRWFFKAKAYKERMLGPNRLFPALRNLWGHVPDGLEARHLELFESHVLLPAAVQPEP